MIFIDICVSIFEFYVFISFFKYIFYNSAPILYKRSFKFLAIAVSCCIFTAGTVIILQFANPLRPVILILFTFTFLLCISQPYQAKVTDRIFYSCVLILLGIGSEIFTGFLSVSLFGGVLPSYPNSDNHYILGTVCSKIVFFILSRLISIFYKKSAKNIPLVYWSILTLIPTVSIFELHMIVLYVADSSYIIYDRVLFLIPGILLINILVFAIYDIISFQYEKMILQEREVINFKNKQKYYALLVAHAHKISSIAHDSNTHLKAVCSLIENGRYEDSLDYARDLGIQYNKTMEFEKILPENKAVSIILETKIKEAETHGIKTERKIDVMAKMPINNTDLCTIFGNAFDNAIRACNEYSGDNKSISIEIKLTYNRISIIIQNTSNPVIIREDGLCETTKKDVLIHGYGLKNIKDIVNSLGGNLQLNYNENIFSLRMIFYI